MKDSVAKLHNSTGESISYFYLLISYSTSVLATNPSRPPLYPIVHIDGDTLSQSLTRFSKYLKSQFMLSYSFHCNINDCYTC